MVMNFVWNKPLSDWYLHHNGNTLQNPPNFLSRLIYVFAYSESVQRDLFRDAGLHPELILAIPVGLSSYP